MVPSAFPGGQLPVVIFLHGWSDMGAIWLEERETIAIEQGSGASMPCQGGKRSLMFAVSFIRLLFIPSPILLGPLIAPARANARSESTVAVLLPVVIQTGCAMSQQ